MKAELIRTHLSLFGQNDRQRDRQTKRRLHILIEKKVFRRKDMKNYMDFLSDMNCQHLFYLRSAYIGVKSFRYNNKILVTE